MLFQNQLTWNNCLIPNQQIHSLFSISHLFGWVIITLMAFTITLKIQAKLLKIQLNLNQSVCLYESVSTKMEKLSSRTVGLYFMVFSVCLVCHNVSKYTLENGFFTYVHIEDDLLNVEHPRPVGAHMCARTCLFLNTTVIVMYTFSFFRRGFCSCNLFFLFWFFWQETVGEAPTEYKLKIIKGLCTKYGTVP